MYDKPNYGANAAMGQRLHAEIDAPCVVPTVGSVTDLTNELHSRLSMLEESLRTVHQRIGASHGPEACGANSLAEANGPVDFAAEQLVSALTRIDNFRIIVETINARI